MTRIVQNQVAVHHAVQAARRSGDVARQTSRLLMQPALRQHLVEAVQVVAAASVTTVDVDVLVAISRDAERQNLELVQVKEAIRERTPFEALLEFLPQDRNEVYQFLGLLVAVLALVVSVRAAEQPRSMTPEQVEQVITQVIDHMEQEETTTTSPPTSTAPAPSSSTVASTSTAPPHCEDDSHGKGRPRG